MFRILLVNDCEFNFVIHHVGMIKFTLKFVLITLQAAIILLALFSFEQWTVINFIHFIRKPSDLVSGKGASVGTRTVYASTRVLTRDFLYLHIRRMIFTFLKIMRTYIKKISTPIRCQIIIIIIIREYLSLCHTESNQITL